MIDIDVGSGLVMSVMIDFGFSLVLESGRFRVEGKFHLRTGDESFVIDPARPPAAMSPALHLARGAVIASARAHDDGKLDIVFANGDELHVDAGPEYEPWEYAGRDRFLVVSMPGGSLAVFEAD